MTETEKLDLIEDGPHFLNENSHFIMVTYWWGRGKINRNYQRPCPDITVKNPIIVKEGITYDEMIKRWKIPMEKLKINHYSVEIPELTKRHVQKGINYKFEFILHCLNKFKDKSIVYMDGDMIVRKYPYIFELTNIDFMAHGWHDGNINALCWDPFLLEVSGGIIFMGNTFPARKILDLYLKEFKLPANIGKADDRILSVILNRENVKLWANVLELSKEYLYLTIQWPENEMKEMGIKKENILIEHPECLTQEELAEHELGNMKRLPIQYNRIIKKSCLKQTDKMFLNIEWMYLNNTYQSNISKDLVKYREKKLKLQETIFYKDKWGALTDRIDKSIDKIKNININYVQDIKSVNMIAFNKLDTGKEVYIKILDDQLIPHVILKLKHKYENFIYMPKNVDKRIITKLFSLNWVEFSTKNLNISNERHRKEYLLKIDYVSPIYFSLATKNKYVKNFLLLWSINNISPNIKDQYKSLEDTFNTSLQALFFMRTMWINYDKSLLI